MYDIRQFKPVLYVLLLLGFSGFSLAAQSPGLCCLSITLCVINAWMVRTKQYKPIPHWLATAITIGALLILAVPLKADPTKAVLVIGQFLVVLQLVKLYEIRANRDYAQLLVLSLLLMVAASINTASLLFGIMLISYLFLSLFCCLLFHLKVETDFAKAAIGLPDETANPVTLRQDQRHLSRSMRRLTAVVASVAITTAVIVFLFFPRGTGAGLLGPLQIKPSQTLSGFNDGISFQKIAQISQNSEQIAWVKVYKDGQLVRGTEPILLRGVALDVYTGNDMTIGPVRRWQRSVDENSRDVEPGHDLRIVPDQPRWRQQITLNPTGTAVLFAMPGLCRVDSLTGADGRVRFWPHDQVLQTGDAIPTPVTYEVESDGVVSNAPAENQYLMPVDPSSDSAANRADGDDTDRDPRQNRGQRHIENPTPQDADTLTSQPAVAELDKPMTAAARPTSWHDPSIEAYARRPEVSGTDANGPLAARRAKTAQVDPLDSIIASNICTYLRQNFTYTLDLTDARDVGDRDPLVAFLYDFKRGHCEYFAGAMALMCQSLGMQARVIVGFRCDEYNPLIDTFMVRQSHAHAWVEVLDPTGIWRTYDPTSGRGDDSVHNNSGLWRRAVQLVQYLQYTWANSVVAYDRDSRASVINNMDRKLTNTAIDSSARAGRVRMWIAEHADTFASRATSVLFVIMILSLIGAVGWFLWERWRLRRRAHRIGLDTLPASDKNRLVRQLGFYDELMLLLDRHRITRSPQMTPMEFSESVTFLPSEVFDEIRRLTEIFYRVRYGRHELTSAQQRHLSAVIDEMSAAFSSKPLYVE